MPLYAAGQRIRGSEINALPQTYRVTTNQVINNNTNLINAVGLAFQGEASAVYLVEGLICYKSNAVPGLKLAWQIPAGLTGWGGMQGGAGPNNRIGDWNTVAYLDDFTATFGLTGDDTSWGATICSPLAVMTVGTTPGTIQLRFAQTTAQVSNTTIFAGSCLRVSRLA
jgi:hypothetical protein